MIKYFSDVTKNFYTSEEECREAENLYFAELEKEKRAEEERALKRKEKEAEITRAAEELKKMRENYEKLLVDFANEYGEYKRDSSNPFFDILDVFTRIF